MTERVRLDWRVPSAPWERFRESVRTEFGTLDSYLGHEAERAMREYIDDDDFAEVEKTVDRLVRAAGRTPGDRDEKINSVSEGETTRVTAYVHEDVKRRFARAADESDDSYGVAFARAIDAYRDPGRAGRVADKLDRVVDDAEKMLEAWAGGDDDRPVGKVQRNTLAICSRLDDEFTDDVLDAEIHDIAATGAKASDPTLEKYRDLVIDRLGVEPHPNVPHLWMPPEEADRLSPDGLPRVCRVPPEHLDADECADRVRLAVGRRAAERSTGRARVSIETIHQNVLEGAPDSRAEALDMMERAALLHGFTVDRDGESASLAVDLSELGKHNADWLESIIDYRDCGAPDLVDDTTMSTMSDWVEPESTESPESPGGSDGGIASLGDEGVTTDGGDGRTSRSDPGGDAGE